MAAQKIPDELSGPCVDIILVWKVQIRTDATG